jgi:hypothetical protein
MCWKYFIPCSNDSFNKVVIQFYDVRFEVLTAMSVKIAVFWDVTQCSLLVWSSVNIMEELPRLSSKQKENS